MPAKAILNLRHYEQIAAQGTQMVITWCLAQGRISQRLQFRRSSSDRRSTHFRPGRGCYPYPSCYQESEPPRRRKWRRFANFSDQFKTETKIRISARLPSQSEYLSNIGLRSNFTRSMAGCDGCSSSDFRRQERLETCAVVQGRYTAMYDITWRGEAHWQQRFGFLHRPINASSRCSPQADN